ncbi:MAG: 3-deoxy-D-manno-octulosonic acid transferase [Planctomycetaceae bacterium]|jgi:3-deoxy-D-manno-octulosonic-acid transferase|nr:3-deoxy-D-manno-octulosonic acid transferase [Planctomycetaceae bacterium]
MFRLWFFNLVYCAALLCFSPLLLYRIVAHRKYREGFKQKWFGRVPKRKKVFQSKIEWPDNKVIWLHAVSVGEVNLLRPLIKRIQQELPYWCCVVSTTSRTGMETARKLYGENLTVFYCPLDFSWAVQKAVQRLRPDVLILAEQELWPNLIGACKNFGTKIAVVNGRFSEKGHLHYYWIRPLLRQMFQQLDLAAVQSDIYAGWFRQLGTSSNAIRVTGSMKFDGAAADRNNAETQHLRRLAGFADTDIVFIAGSTQAPEELYALQCYENLKDTFPQLRLVLVPRHRERFEETAAMLNGKGVQWQRRSTLPSAASRILLVDTVGELGAWWGTAAIAFVGGSFGKRGGQNMIEPAAYGAAVSFGPNTANFRDISDLMLQSKAAVIVHDQYELEQFVRRCLEKPEYAAELGTNAEELVQRQLGATQRTLDLLQALFHSEEEEDSDITHLTVNETNNVT